MKTGTGLVTAAIVVCAVCLAYSGWSVWQWYRMAPLRTVEAANIALYQRMTSLKSDWAEGCTQAALTSTLTDNMLPRGTFAGWGVAHSEGVTCTQKGALALTCKLAPGATLALTEGSATTGLINVAGSPRTFVISANSIGCLQSE